MAQTSLASGIALRRYRGEKPEARKWGLSSNPLTFEKPDYKILQTFILVRPLASGFQLPERRQNR
jgi:hypothetical protein